MNYQQFVIVVKEKFAQLLDEDIVLQVHTALKNNGRERVGLTITKKQINISPTIYLEEFYQLYQQGMDIPDIAERLLDIYHEVHFEHDWQINIVKDFESIRQKIVYKLINEDKNRTLLENMPHVTYLDFAVTYYILYEIEESGIATIPITNELLQLWDVTLEEIQQNAVRNTPTLLPANFKSMQLVIDELTGTNYSETEDLEGLMYVLTNNLRTFGAACILYNDILEQIAEELGENYYILPSSIHEMIIVPESNSPSKEHLEEIVSEVNQTQVDEEELLSDKVYYYSLTTKSLS